MIDPLQQPISIGSMDLHNRICMPAMDLRMAEGFMVTPSLIDFYSERAAGGAALVTVGYGTIDPRSGDSMGIGAFADKFMPGLTSLAGAIHAQNARAALQLSHAGFYTSSALRSLQSSVTGSGPQSHETTNTAHEPTVEEINEIVSWFVAGAARAKTAGFDAVELLCGGGDLISEFLSPLTNRRVDEYGRTLDGRLRFPLQLLQSMRDALGATFPIIVRVNGNDLMKGGQGSEELATVAERLVATGTADAVSVNVGWHEARVPQITAGVPRGAFAYLARQIRERVHVPVIAAHRINDVSLARQLVADGWCDLVAMGRALIADPFLPIKAFEGREDEIVHCIGCVQGCFDHLVDDRPIECLCNPMAGHERTRRILRASASRRVVIVGGGPAGMSAALAAADRGHKVTLFESGSRLGGQLNLASVPPGREEFATLVADLERQVAARRVDVVLGTEVDSRSLLDLSPDAVVLATGARPVVPRLPGVDLPNVVQAHDVLSGAVVPRRSVVVMGGGAVGVETALFLAAQGSLSAEVVRFLFVNSVEPSSKLRDLARRGPRHVTLIELVEKIGVDIGRSSRWALLSELRDAAVELRPSTRAVFVSPDGVGVATADGESVIPADTVVLAVGSVSYNPLQRDLETTEVEWHVVGDARTVRTAFEAVHEGFLVGRSL